MNFGEALELLKEGKKICRKGWNGKNMFIKIIPAGNAMYIGFNMQDCIGIKTPKNEMQPGWLPSQQDLFAEDWQELN